MIAVRILLSVMILLICFIIFYVVPHDDRFKADIVKREQQYRDSLPGRIADSVISKLKRQ